MKVVVFDNRETLPEYVQRILDLNLKNNEIILITNTRERCLTEALQVQVEAGKLRIIKPYDIEGYQEAEREFDQVFINYSSNPHDFERACFLRWIAVSKMVEMLHLQPNDLVAAIDTDFLFTMRSTELVQRIYSCECDFDIAAEWRVQKEAEINAISPEITLVRVSTLKELAEFICKVYYTSVYRVRHAELLSILRAQGFGGGICDMRCIAEFIRVKHRKALNLRTLKDLALVDSFNGLVEDCQRSHLKGFSFYESGGIWIRRGWRNKRLIGIHFQGSAKEYIEYLMWDSSPLLIDWKKAYAERINAHRSQDPTSSRFRSAIRRRGKRFLLMIKSWERRVKR